MKYLLIGLLFVSCASEKIQEKHAKNELSSVESVSSVKSDEKKNSKMPKANKDLQVKTSLKSIATSSSDQSVTCVYGDNQRVIENRKSETGGCEVAYTKDNELKIIATAQNEVDHCQEVYDRVLNKLKNADFKCK